MDSAMMGLDQNLIDLLDCPVCMNFMYPPIYQCPSGHILCSNCKRNVNNCCPSCRNVMGDIRSLIIEKMAESLEFPCRFLNEGCSGSFMYNLKQEHEERCRYRPYKCPFPCCPPCTIAGDIKLLVTHMRVDHQAVVKVAEQIDELFFLNLDPDEYTSCNFTIYNYLSKHFCLSLAAPCWSGDLLCLYATFMGDEMDAMNYRYKLAIGNDDRKMTWKGWPRSIREDTDEIRESCEGLILPKRLVRSFADIKTATQIGVRVRGAIWDTRSLRQAQRISLAPVMLLQSPGREGEGMSPSSRRIWGTSHTAPQPSLNSLFLDPYQGTESPNKKNAAAKKRNYLPLRKKIEKMGFM